MGTHKDQIIDNKHRKYIGSKRFHIAVHGPKSSLIAIQFNSILFLVEVAIGRKTLLSVSVTPRQYMITTTFKSFILFDSIVFSFFFIFPSVRSFLCLKFVA